VTPGPGRFQSWEAQAKVIQARGPRQDFPPPTRAPQVPSYPDSQPTVEEQTPTMRRPQPPPLPQQTERKGFDKKQTKQVKIVRKYIKAETPPSHRFLFELFYKNQVVSALLDSGADISVVSTRWADKHPELKRKKSTQILRSAFGDPIKNPEELEIPLVGPKSQDQMTISCAVVPLTGPADILLSDDARRMLKIEWPEGQDQESQGPCDQIESQPRYKVVGEEPVTEHVSHTDTHAKITQPIPLQVERLLLLLCSAINVRCVFFSRFDQTIMSSVIE